MFLSKRHTSDNGTPVCSAPLLGIKSDFRIDMIDRARNDSVYTVASKNRAYYSAPQPQASHLQKYVQLIRLGWGEVVIHGAAEGGGYK